MTMHGVDKEFLLACELHDPARLRAALEGGLSPSAPLRGRTPVDWLTSMYTRSDRFPECVRILLEHGAALTDPALGAVLLDDAKAVTTALEADPEMLGHRTTLVSAFTPLEGATLLHVAAEYGHLAAAGALLERGADPNAPGATDPWGLGGQTPLFHTVNSNANRSLPVLRLLLSAGARVDVRLAGLTWGRGFEWETTLFDVTPVSYAQSGLLPQMHRDERHVDETVRLLLGAAGRPIPPMANVPNVYLAGSRPDAEVKE